MKALEKIGTGIMGIVLVLLCLYGIIDVVMYFADWFRWLGLF
jgi:hypothetical protein